jgi:hypothetical protein
MKRKRKKRKRERRRKRKRKREKIRKAQRETREAEVEGVPDLPVVRAVLSQVIRLTCFSESYGFNCL